MPISDDTDTTAQRAASSLHGLVVLNSIRKTKTGATRSIRLAETPLRELGIHLHFVPARSILHFLHSFPKIWRFRYDFCIFNGLASLSGRSRFGYPLWRGVQVLGVPTLIYWHETAWVLDRHRIQDPAGAQRIDRIACQPSVVHLTASQAGSECICNRYPDAEPIAVYECAVVPVPFDQPVRPTDPPLVVNVASIQERKGTDLWVETAIEVCRRHPTVEFLWLGDGRTFGTWQVEIEAAKLENRILFPGYVHAAHLLTRRASIFFLSSRDDPFPLSILEAMCLGRTIVAFDIGGVSEALAGQGILVQPFDTYAAAAAILDRLSQPPAALINEALRCRYLDQYTPWQFARRLDYVIREQIASER
jgi:glycosyltransferase involved in cell wall biosynthesis